MTTRRFLVRGTILHDKKVFCIVEKEIWAATGNQAKQIFQNEQSGDGFSVRNVEVKEIR